MSKYIDADKLYELIRTNDYKLATKNGSIDYGMFTVGIKQAIDEMPTADVVEVVRCKDCTEWDKDEYECSHWYGFREDDYCSYGARMGGGVKE